MIKLYSSQTLKNSLMYISKKDEAFFFFFNPTLSLETFFFWIIDRSTEFNYTQQVAANLFGSPNCVNYCDANHAHSIPEFK